MFPELTSWGDYAAAAAVAVATVGALRWMWHMGRHVEVLADIAHEFRPNNGSSLRDAVDRLEAGQGATAARLEKVESDVHAVKTSLSALTSEVEIARWQQTEGDR